MATVAASSRLPSQAEHGNGATSGVTGRANGSAIEHRHVNGQANSGNANGHARSNIPAYRPPLLDSSLLPNGQHSLSGIALRAFCLGIALGFSALVTALLAYSGSPLWRTPFFLLCLSIFHFLEFWTTAAYNTPLATNDAFLLNANGAAYKAAHITAFLETTVVHSMLPYPQLLSPWASYTWLGIGFVIVVLGQTARSLSMIQCGRNFNHTVQTYRRQEHELVTHGVYGWSRHPSYFGFFWWALGTQVVLGNVVCLVAYSAVLWRFFAHRIRKEEYLLVEFFGKEYEEYRRRTRVGIPFVR